jgi:hypothetical protein
LGSSKWYFRNHEKERRTFKCLTISETSRYWKLDIPQAFTPCRVHI